MTMNNVSVRKFILFNTSWGRKEGHEDEKIIYSSSMPCMSTPSSPVSPDGSKGPNPLAINDTSSSDQSSSKSSQTPSTIDPEELESRDDLKQISLCEASIGLMNLFRKPKKENEQSAQHDEQPMSMEGYADDVAAASGGNSANSSVSTCFIVYQLLASLYSSFKRQNGPLSLLSVGGETSASIRLRVRKRCQLFFQWILPHTFSGSDFMTPASSSAVLPAPTPFNVFGGRGEGLMKYLSLDGQSFMSVRSFVNHSTFSTTMNPKMGVVFLYNDNLITSTLSLLSTRILYSYTTIHIIPEAAADELSWNKKRADKTSYWYSDRKPILLYLRRDEEVEGGRKDSSNNEAWIKKDIYIYRSLNGSTIVSVFDSLDQISNPHLEKERKEILDSLDLYSRQHLYNLTAMISKASVMAMKATSFSHLSSLSSGDRHLFLHPHQPTSVTSFGSNSSLTSLNVFGNNDSSSTGVSSASDSGLSFLYYNETNGALKTFLSPVTARELLPRQGSSSGLFSSPVTSSTASGSDPFSRWTALESDFRTILLPSAKKLVRRRVKAIAKNQEKGQKEEDPNQSEDKEFPENNIERSLSDEEDSESISTSASESCPSSSNSSPKRTDPDKEVGNMDDKNVSSRERSQSSVETKGRRRNKTAEGGMEILAKTDSDENWIVFKRSDQRTLYATLSSHKNYNLEEVAAVVSSKYQSGGGSSFSSASSRLSFPFSSLFQ